MAKTATAEKPSKAGKQQEAAEASNSDDGFFLGLMILLILAILWTGLETALQVQAYRQDYQKLRQLKLEYQALQVEHQRLIIEQQTFSATPQIASRAVAQLGMHLPSAQEKWVLSLQPAAPAP